MHKKIKDNLKKIQVLFLILIIVFIIIPTVNGQGVNNDKLIITDSEDFENKNSIVYSNNQEQNQNYLSEQNKFDKNMATILFFIILLMFLIFLYIDKKKDVKNILASKFKHLKFLKNVNIYTWYLFLSLIAVFILKIIISYFFIEPRIYYDEHTYLTISSQIASGKLQLVGQLTNNIQITHPYPAGYSYFISPAYLFGGNNVELVYRGVLFINVLLTTLLMIPTFLILKRFVSKKLAFLSSLIVTSLPAVSCHTYLAMSENAFYFIFLISCLFLIKTFENNKLNKKFIFYGLVTGIFIAILITIKATGIAMFFALIGVIILKLINDKKVESIKYFILTIPVLPVIIYAFFGNESQVLGYQINNYVSLNKAMPIGEQISKIFQVTINEISYLALMGYIIFFAFSIFLIVYLKKVKKEKRTTLSIFVWYSILSTIFLIIITVNHIYTSNSTIYTRYISPGLITLILLGIIGIDLFRKKASEKVSITLLFFILISSMLVIIWFPFENYNLANNLDLIWIFSIGKDSLKYIRILVGFILIPLSFYLVYKYTFNIERLKKGKKSLKKKFEKYNYISTIIIVIIIITQLFLYIPTHSKLVDAEEELLDRGFNKCGKWFMINDNDASVIIVDYFAANSKANISVTEWFYTYVNMLYYMPYGSIQIIDNSSLNSILENKSINADYILTTFELDSNFTKVDQFYLYPDNPTYNVDDLTVWFIYK